MNQPARQFETASMFCERAGYISHAAANVQVPDSQGMIACKLAKLRCVFRDDSGRGRFAGRRIQDRENAEKVAKLANLKTE